MFLLASASAQDRGFEFYGYTSDAAPRRAFLREGQKVFIAAEGDLIKERYKVVRIGLESAVIEDTANKQRQTLPLAPRNPVGAEAAVAEPVDQPQRAVRPPQRRRR